jgi:hypothetical protein
VTSRYNYKTNMFTVDCDQPGCHVNHECEAGSFRSGWLVARSAGWAYLASYDQGNIKVDKHFCPAHAEQFDRPRGG